MLPRGKRKREFPLVCVNQNMIKYQKDNGIKAAAVIGGGLLGLEAAKAMYDLGMETHIIEYAPILMCRQVRRQEEKM